MTVASRLQSMQPTDIGVPGPTRVSLSLSSPDSIG